jgi:hypothetical protein
VDRVGPGRAGDAVEAGIGFDEQRPDSTTGQPPPTVTEDDLWPWRRIDEVAATVIAGLRIAGPP